MKKLLSVLLICCLLMGLVACSSAGGETATTAAKDERLRVGYAREDITPKSPVGLTGYGNETERKHKNVLDFLYLTCVAITDKDDNTVIMMTIDLGNMIDSAGNTVREKVSKATGVPRDNITLSCTHSHSVPAYGSISSQVLQAAAKAAKAAMEDREYADMYMGQTNTVGLNFVRHYVMDDGSVVGDNFGDPTGKTYVKHTSEADSQMQLLQFKREGKKDVLMVNWQSHPHITGGFSKYDLSADIVGAFRDCIEKSGDYLFAYYQGAAGNLNPTGKVPGDNANTSEPKNYRVHGELLTMHAKEALANMTQLDATGSIVVHMERFEGECFHGDGDLAAYASDVIAYYDQGHTPTETRLYAIEQDKGIHSVYHARAILNRTGHGATESFPITTIRIGEVGFATIPGELFDTNGMYIKENSPMKMTFVMGYCNGSVGYLPSEFAFGHGSYEVDTGVYAKGTAEKVASRHVEILNELAK